MSFPEQDKPQAASPEEVTKELLKYLADAMQKQRDQIKEETDKMSSVMSPSGTPGDKESDDKQLFKNQLVPPEVVEEYAKQYALQMNILNYKAANTAYIDGVSVAKTMGIWEDVKDKVCPFPGFNNQIIIAPPPHPPQMSESMMRSASSTQSKEKPPVTASEISDIVKKAVENSIPVQQNVSTGNNDPWKWFRRIVTIGSLIGAGTAIPLGLDKIFSGSSMVQQTPSTENKQNEEPVRSSNPNVTVEIM